MDPELKQRARLAAARISRFGAKIGKMFYHQPLKPRREPWKSHGNGDEGVKRLAPTGAIASNLPPQIPLATQ